MPTVCPATGCKRRVDPNTAVYKLVAGAGGLDPNTVEVGEFCSAGCADRVPRPSDEAIERARAKLAAKAGRRRRGSAQ